MPALRLLGRRWLIAGDDVPAPAAFLAVFHTVWVALLITWLAEIKGPEDCVGVGPYYTAVGGLLAAFTLCAILETAAAVVGLQGSLFETQKRSALPALIYTIAVCVLAQIGFNGYATHLLYSDPPVCSPDDPKPWDPTEVLFGLVWSTWAVIIGLLGLTVAAYNLFPDYRSSEQWEAQCKCLSATFCGLRQGKMDHGVASKRLGALFAIMFSHIDLTPSDTVTAFGLVLNRQRFLRRLAKKLDEKTHTRPRGLHSSVTIGAVHPTESANVIGSVAEGEFEGDGEESSIMSNNNIDERHTGPAGSDDGLLSNAEMGLGVNSGREEGELGTVDADTLADAAYYMKYAFAAYGWMLFVWQRKTAGCVQLCCGRACGMWAGSVSHSKGSWNAPLKVPRLNTEAIIQAADILEEDLLFVRLEGEGANVLPYFLAIDHDKRTVVLAIRGSLSLEDCVRDLLFEPADLDEWVQGHEEWGAPLPELRPATSSTRYAGHSGIHEAARATLADVQANGHLMEAFQGPAQGYSLVVCGHSLGAGCAFLINVYLRKFFPNTRCLAFSPPGGLVTPELSESAVDWCTSVVCGKEMVPRLTLATFERARDEMVSCAARCRRPKVSLLLGWAVGRVWRDADVFYSDEALPAEPRRWLEEYRVSLESTASKRAYVESAAQFGPPGRVMHLKPTGERSKESVGWGRKKINREYRCVWIDGQTLVERGVIMSGRMMADHMPDYCLSLLRRLAAAAAGDSDTAVVSDAAGEREVKSRVKPGEGEGSPPAGSRRSPRAPAEVAMPVRSI